MSTILTAKQKTTIRAGQQPSFDRVVFPMVAVVIVGYFLFVDNTLPFSINRAWRCISHAVNASNNHIITVVGLVPVYVALMIFGAAVLGGFAGYSFRTLYAQMRSFKAK